MASKTALLDVNILIALLDRHHQFHQITTAWLYEWKHAGNHWLSCPITQNGCLRILSLPSYKHGVGLMAIKQELTNLTHASCHRFIPDDISLLSDELINWQHIQGGKQLTDAYLLALARHHGAVFVSLDNRINTHLVHGVLAKDCLFLSPKELL